MRIRNLLYIFLATFFSLVSCTDEKIFSNGYDPENPELGEGEFLLKINLSGFDARTRDISFTEGATVRINSVWIGAFDLTTGECVAKEHTNQDYAIVAAGEEASGVIRVKLGKPEPYEEGKKYFMIAVANYKDVNGYRVTPEIDTHEAVEVVPLESLLSEVTNWDEFNEIGVETTSAYAGDHNQDSPILAGFLNNKNVYDSENPSNTHVKVDQYATSGGVNFSPEKLLDKETYLKDALAIEYKDATGEEEKGKYVTSGMEELDNTVFFRRLVANINVNIVPGPDSPIKITGINYRRYNMPRVVYIVERRMLNDEGNFPSEGLKSPNIGDINPAIGYYSDNDWLDGPTRNSDGSWKFSYQHFANKHWARTNVSKYDDREKFTLDDDGNKVFTALASTATDINNYAGYFVLKMHMVDEANNRCAEAEYTIHEGYTSNADGYATDTDDKLMDFSTARNINYNYNIHVYNFNNVTSNVTSNGTDATEENHHADQGGRVWQIKYANEKLDVKDGEHTVHYNSSTGDYTGAISHEGGRFSKAIHLKPDPGKKTDIAFRLYGWTKYATTTSGEPLDYQIAGYNFNFPEESFQWLKGLWPESAGNKSHYFYIDGGEGTSLTEKSIPEDLLKGLVIYEEGNTENGMNIVQFINAYNGEKGIGLDKWFDIEIKYSDVTSAPLSDKKDYIRAIFIADRNGITDKVDGCTQLVNIYAAVQDPPTYKTFEAEPVFMGEQYDKWKNHWNSSNASKGDKYLIHYATSFTEYSDSWRGSINSIVNLGFRFKETINNHNSFKVDILQEGEVKKTQIFQSVNLNELLYDDFSVLPLNTSGLSAGTYDVRIAINEENGVEIIGNIPLEYPGKLILKGMKWSFSDSYPWLSITNTSLFGNVTSDKRAANKTYSEKSNFFVEYFGLEMAYYAIKNDALQPVSGYFTSFIDFDDNVTNGPTNGRPFYLKFKAVKNGTLKILYTGTNKETADQTGKTIHILVDGIEKHTPTSFPGGNYNKTNTANITRTFEISGVSEEGSEIIICNDFTNKSGIRFYGVEYVSNE